MLLDKATEIGISVTSSHPICTLSNVSWVQLFTFVFFSHPLCAYRYSI